jgi:predicted AlkP superfamily phosphohydrolase/phosphomutase
LILCSEHGMSSFSRGVNLNTWLAEQGFLVFNGQEDGQPPSPESYSRQNFLQGVDWSRTRAYSLGLGLIYVNLAGRERQGIVQPGKEHRSLKAEIARKLLDLRDPELGAVVVQSVHDAEQIYSGPAIESQPDLVVGFARDYRVSWETALGAVPPGVIVVNDQKWSGDHASVDSTLVPGFIATNRKIVKEAPSILDIAPTVLGLFGLSAETDGRPLFEP